MTDRYAQLRFKGRWLALVYFETELPQGAPTEGLQLVSDRGERMKARITNGAPGALCELVAPLPHASVDGAARTFRLVTAGEDVLTEEADYVFPQPDGEAEIRSVVDRVVRNARGIEIEGWSVNWLAPTERTVIACLIDGYETVRTEARLLRSDFLKHGFSDGHHGFRVLMRGPLAMRGRLLEVLANGVPVHGSPWPLDADDETAAKGPDPVVLASEAMLAAADLASRLSSGTYVDGDAVARLAASVAELAGRLPKPAQRAERPSETSLADAGGRSVALVHLPAHAEPGDKGAGEALTRLVSGLDADIVLLADAGTPAMPAAEAALAKAIAGSALVDAAGLVEQDDPAAGPRPVARIGRTPLLAFRRDRLSWLLGEGLAEKSLDLAMFQAALGEREDLFFAVCPTAEAGAHASGAARALAHAWPGDLAAIVLAGAGEVPEEVLAEIAGRRAAGLALSGFRCEVVLSGPRRGTLEALLASRGLALHRSDTAKASLSALLRLPDLCIVLHAGDPGPHAPDCPRDIPLRFEALDRLSGSDGLQLPFLASLSGQQRRRIASAGLVPALTVRTEGAGACRLERADGDGAWTGLSALLANAGNAPLPATLSVPLPAARLAALLVVERGGSVVSDDEAIIEALARLGLGRDLLAGDGDDDRARRQSQALAGGVSEAR